VWILEHQVDPPYDGFMRTPESEEIIPSISGRARKHESTVSTFALMDGLVPIGEYQRLSLAKSDAQAQAMAMGRQDTHDAVEKQGAFAFRSYSDPDHSGSKRHVDRPAFNRMLADLDAGLIQGIACSDIDRVTRLHGILERLIERYEDHPEYYWYSNDAKVDLRTEEGRDEARSRVDAANKEAKAIARRQKARHDQYRKLGYMVGTKAYGHTTKGAIVPEEADIIRLLADTVDQGRPIKAILDQLTEQGIRGRNGQPWSHRTVQSILLSGRIAGYRVDGKGLALDDDGNPIIGNQEPIISVAQWERIQLRYRTRERGEDFRKYLGSGSFICTCGATMGAGWQVARNRHRYLCIQGRGSNCGSNTLHGPWADQALELLVEMALARDTPAVAEPEPWPDSEKLTRLEAKRAAARARRDAGELDAETWLDQDMAIAEVAGKLRRAQREWAKAHPVRSMPANQTLVDRWNSGDDDQRRSVVRDLFRGVLVQPANRVRLPVAERLSPILRDL
jgi:site-specific DNA recombinase